MSVPTGTARYTRAGVALAVAAVAIVGTASNSFAVGGASSGAAATAAPLTGATSAVVTLTAPANTFKTATNISKVAALATASNSVLFSATACPANAADVSNNVTTAPPKAATMVEFWTQDPKTVTTTAGTFAQSDVGKVVSDTTHASDIPAGTTIVSVTSNGKHATLSNAVANSRAASETLSITGSATTITDGTFYANATATTATVIGSALAATATYRISGAGVPVGTTMLTDGTGSVGTLTLGSGATTVNFSGRQGVALNSVSPDPTALASAVYPASAITVVSGSKLVVKAPVWAQPGTYNVCVFDSSTTNGTGTGAVIASGAYTVANVLATAKYTVATPPSSIAIQPSSGPSGSSTAVTITGNNLGTAPTATLGGVAVVLKSAGTNTFTATFPAHAPGGTPLVVSTAGGPAPAATFTYLDGITVQPTTIPAGNTTILDITGGGFLTGSVALNFPTGASSFPLADTLAHVFLVKGQYVNTTAGPDNLDQAECTNVTVVSDTELICTLDTTSVVNTPAAALGNGAYQVVIVSNGDDNAGDGNSSVYRQTIITSQSTFTVAPY